MSGWSTGGSWRAEGGVSDDMLPVEVGLGLPVRAKSIACVSTPDRNRHP